MVRQWGPEKTCAARLLAGFRAFGLEQDAIKVGEQYFHKCHMTLDLRGADAG